MERKNNSSGFWVGIFFGAILSAILLVLMGTKEGREFAKKMKKRIEGQLDDLEYEIQREGGVIDQAEELKEQALIAASEKSREAAKKVKEVRNKVESKSQDVASKIGNRIFRKQGKS